MLHSTVLKMNGQSKNMSLTFSWNGDIHSASLRFYVLKASSLPQSQWRLRLRHRLVLVITQRLMLIFDPFLFFWNSTPLTLICRAALTKPGKSNLRNKCSEKQICRFSFIFPFTCSSHPWPFPLCAARTQKHTSKCMQSLCKSWQMCGLGIAMLRSFQHARRGSLQYLYGDKTWLKGM